MIRNRKWKRHLVISIMLCAFSASLGKAGIGNFSIVQFAHAQSQYTEQQWRTYANVTNSIREITASLNRQLGQADPEDAQMLRLQTEQQIIISIENGGLTVEEYNIMTDALYEDMTLRNRVEFYISEANRP